MRVTEINFVSINILRIVIVMQKNREFWRYVFRIFCL